MMMSKVISIAPMIPTYDLFITGKFFMDVLDFNLFFESDNYAIYKKDGFEVHLLRAGSDIGEMSFYMEVDDADNVWMTIKDKVEGLRVREPFNQNYGMREIHIELPMTKTLMFIGQDINRTE